MTVWNFESQGGATGNNVLKHSLIEFLENVLKIIISQPSLNFETI